MGTSYNCCFKNSFLITEEVNSFPNNPENKDKLNNENLNNSFMNDPQYQNLANDFFVLLNEIRSNPYQYIKDSRENSLLEIFIKLKPCKKLSLLENNNNKLKNYLINSYFQKKSIYDQEKEIKSLIDDGNVKELCLFQTIFMDDNMKDNVWLFLKENEDDFDKIFKDEYNYLIVICFPLECNSNILTSVIFY